ncbi:MAG: iron-containing alcohol dehydrogenase [Planctomycetes bacterium]|nr:iron-containing alcohol dehydrogenase [Planctomycetota bacterium]
MGSGRVKNKGLASFSSALENFEFAGPGRIVFGWDRLAEIGALLGPDPKRVFLLGGASRRHVQRLAGYLEDSGCEFIDHVIAREPTLTDMDLAADLARDFRAEWIIGLGGGSVLDAAKTLAVVLGNGSPLLEHLEIIGGGRPLRKPGLPCLAIPTTAGTGAEATRNAVITSSQHRLKVSLRHPFLLPSIALIDPELSADMPPLLTATTGMDALTQLIEAALSLKANPLTEALCFRGIALAASCLPRAFGEPSNREAREGMALASLYGGMALANAGLGAVHGLAGVVGGRTGAPHGAICAALLAPVMRVNLGELRRTSQNPDALARFEKIACLIKKDESASAEDGIARIEALTREMGVAKLVGTRIESTELDEMAEQSLRASSMKGNPVTLKKELLKGLLASLGE